MIIIIALARAATPTITTSIAGKWITLLRTSHPQPNCFWFRRILLLLLLHHLLICMARTFDVRFCVRYDLWALCARHVLHSIYCSEAAAFFFLSRSLVCHVLTFHLALPAPVCAFCRVFEIFQLIFLQTDTWCVYAGVFFFILLFIVTLLCLRFVHRRSYVFDVFVVLRAC